MITDRQRREVAERLRILASHAPADKDYVLDALGLYPGEYIDGFDPYRVNELADLIDRLTCHLIEDEDGYTACSECGCTALCMRNAVFCPSCGARVIHNEENDTRWK
jgi:hypothetical protein